MLEERKRKILELKKNFRAVDPRPQLSFSRLKTSIPMGCLVEISAEPGLGAAELILSLAAEHPHLRIACLEEDNRIFPRAFPQHRVSLDRILFVETGSQTLWTLQQLLKSGLFQILIVRGAIDGSSNLKRLQLLSEAVPAIVLFWTDRPSEINTWYYQLQIHIPHRNKFEVLRQRGASPWMEIAR